MEAESTINMLVVAEQFRQATQPMAGMATTVIDFSNRDVTPQQQPFTDADLVIRGIHNLPVRARCAHSSFAGHRSATEAMRRQMESGEYPTLEAHRNRSSVAYEPSIDEMGRFAARRLTKEDEDAIRTRANRDTVQRSP